MTVGNWSNGTSYSDLTSFQNDDAYSKEELGEYAAAMVGVEHNGITFDDDASTFTGGELTQLVTDMFADEDISELEIDTVVERVMNGADTVTLDDVMSVLDRNEDGSFDVNEATGRLTSEQIGGFDFGSVFSNAQKAE